MGMEKYLLGAVKKFEIVNLYDGGPFVGTGSIPLLYNANDYKAIYIVWHKSTTIVNDVQTEIIFKDPVTGTFPVGNNVYIIPYDYSNYSGYISFGFSSDGTALDVLYNSGAVKYIYGIK